MQLRGRWPPLRMKQYFAFRREWRSCFKPEAVEAGATGQTLAAFGYCPNGVARE
jgi:hypothetical protein